MLIYLQRWARDHGIGLELFNPSKSVRERLKMVSSLSDFDIPTLDEMMALLGRAIADMRLLLNRLWVQRFRKNEKNDSES